MLECGLTLRPSDVEALLASSLDPIEPLLEGSPDWCKDASQALSADSLGMCLFGDEEMESMLFDSPTALHFSPPAQTSQWRAPSEDPTVISGGFEEEEEQPCAKRQRLDAPAAYGLLLPAAAGKPSWQHVEVQQMEQQRDTQLAMMMDLDQLPAGLSCSQTSNPLYAPLARPCAPGGLIPESCLMPGLSQPSSPSPAKSYAREPSASPNKPLTPARMAMRSPFVTRPTRLAFEATFEAARSASPQPPTQAAAATYLPLLPVAQQEQHGAAFGQEDTIRLAAAALLACGGSADAAISYLLQLGGTAAAAALRP